MSGEIAFSLTTQIKPAKKFTIDGVEYQMKGVDHLSPDDEARVLALFSRHAILVGELEVEKNSGRGEGIAKAARETRLRIVRKLTDIPAEIAETLPLTVQVKLLEAIKEELQADAEEDDEPNDAVGRVDDELGTS